MSAWWERLGQGDGTPRPQGASVYAERFTDSAQGPRVAFEDGRFVEVEPCCENPALCQRPECWTPVGGLRP